MAREYGINSNFETKKTKYFSSFAVRLKEAFRLHKSFDLLRKNERRQREWGNVSEHCLVVAARSKALAKLLGLSQQTKDDLVLAAAMHDFYKKNQIEKTPKGVSLSMADFMASEREANAELTKARIDQNIIDYTGSVGALPEAIYKIQAILEKGKNASQEELATLAIHYVDDYTIESGWASPAEQDPNGKKINDLNRRVQKARNNPKYKAIDEQGREYFNGQTALDVQETVGEEVEKFLAVRVAKIQNLNLDPKDLPVIVDQEIKNEIEESQA